MINIIYEDNHLLVVEKPINMPVQADESQDKDLLTALKKYLKQKYNKINNVYLGLIHRLDRPVGGLMVFAKTSKAANRLSIQIKNHDFIKTYYAVVIGNIDDKGIFIDKLLKDRKNNIVKINETGKEAILEYEKVMVKENFSLVKINLITGRSHQIRVQFSSKGYPLYGDQKYNKDSKNKEQIALFSKEISLIHPITKIRNNFSIELPNRYPFTLFK